MKKGEKLAIVCVVIYCLSKVIWGMREYLTTTLILKLDWPSNLIWLLYFPTAIVGIAINIAIAIWLYRVSKRENSAPWVWAMFGFLFGILGVILFYTLKIYETLKKKDIREPKVE